MTKRQGCQCLKCKECCEREPGWFVPDDLPLASHFMNLSEREFVVRFCEEHREDGVLAISPARKPGKSECVFLTPDRLCQIHEVKPFECRKIFGCEGVHRHRRIREIIKGMWG